MRFVLGMLAAAAITGFAFVQPAEARCFWNGFAMECFHHPHFGYWHRPYWDRGFVDRGFVAERPYRWGY